MKCSTVRMCSASLITLLSFAAPLFSQRQPIKVRAGQSRADAASVLRPVTVTDVIRMARVRADGPIASFSPDATKFVIIVTKGNLARNTNDSSLLLFRTSEALTSPAPDVLLTMSSSSNGSGAVNQLVWQDNETIAFLGETPNSVKQLYTFNIGTRLLTQVTHQRTSLLYYSLGPDGEFAYVTQAASVAIANTEAYREGIVVSSQRLDSLISGHDDGGDFGRNRLFVVDGRGTREISVPGRISSNGICALSPDGQFLVVRSHVDRIPAEWKRYSDPLLKEFTATQLSHGQVSWITAYVLVSAHSGKSEQLMPSPIQSLDSSIAWAPDSRSVAVAGVYLPINASDQGQLKARESKTFLAEVELQTRRVIVISPEDELGNVGSEDYTRKLVWNPVSRVLTYLASKSMLGAPQSVTSFRRTNSGWERLASAASEKAQPQITLEQDMNVPPRIVATDVGGHRKQVLLDLNPQFKALTFATVEEVEWNASDGHEVRGGLYYPVNYKKGSRYPLVIQTHGWERSAFWIDGPFSTGFAAQALAGKDIFVLQADEIWGGSEFDTPSEFAREVSTLEGAIKYLDERGLIDRNHVGIFGFSRTGTVVAFALTHSEYRFAAASVADGSDFGDFEFMVFANTSPDAADTVEKFYGGLPVGGSLKQWMALSPHFSLDKVHTPLRLLATTPEMLLGQWGWFTTMVALNKPIEMIYLPKGVHVLQKPWDRLISQQGNVDWFAYWLKDEEDPDPTKIEEYRRWHDMKAKIDSSELD